MANSTDEVIRSPKGGETGLINAIKRITNNDAETYYIIYLYAKELLPKGDEIKSYADLQNVYAAFKNRTEQSCQKFLYKEDVQQGIKYLLRRLDGKRDTALLNKYYELAMSGDVQALKAYMDFKKSYFADNDEADELKAILKGVKINNNDDDDFEMSLD